MGSNKKLMIAFAFVATASSASAQTFDEWFNQKKTQIKYLEEQIAALEVYDQLLQSGYGVVRGGLQVIGDLKQGDLDLHHDYFTSLKTVNPNISHNAQTNDGKQLYADILSVCAQVDHLTVSLPPAEKSQARILVSHLETSCANAYHHYQWLMCSGHYQLTDDERLQQINKRLSELSDQYGFIRHFHQQLDILRVQEAQEALTFPY